jgi:DNA-binding transcriptional LysR family regulator
MLRELKTLLAVDRWGTFAAAGAHIGLTQSAVSAQIQRLEEALGAPLFDRTGRSARLNEAGRDALPMARRMLELFDEMSERATTRELRGSLRLGSVQSAQVGVLPHALSLLHARHRQVSVRLVQGTSLSLIGEVDGGGLDAALMVLPPFALPQELLWQPLLSQPFVLAVPSEEPSEEPGDDWRRLLASRPFIRYDRASFGGRAVDRFLRRQGLRPDAVIEMEDVDAMTSMVAGGLGVALLPIVRERFPPPGVRLLSLGEVTFHREIGIVFNRSPDRPVDALRECLVEAASQLSTAHARLGEPREAA